MDFQQIKKTWDKIISEQSDVIQKAIKGVTSLEQLELNLIEEHNDYMDIEFSNMNSTTDDPTNTSPMLKTLILKWLRTFAMVRIHNTPSDQFRLRLSDMSDNEEELEEAAVKVFKRNGRGGLKTAYKCMGGPKDGRKVSSPDACNSYVDPKISRSRKISSRKNKAKMKNSRMKDKMTNVVSRKRLNRANKRMKKARGF